MALPRTEPRLFPPLPQTWGGQNVFADNEVRLKSLALIVGHARPALLSFQNNVKSESLLLRIGSRAHH